mmetsp:Transcript_3649/g.7842  ORF Transcript_3649/g.7842 Transcript_3649/m.7842 type:complete len:533 (+) Transcript_3649:3-1601(+)
MSTFRHQHKSNNGSNSHTSQSSDSGGPHKPQPPLQFPQCRRRRVTLLCVFVSMSTVFVLIQFASQHSIARKQTRKQQQREEPIFPGHSVHTGERSMRLRRETLLGSSSSSLPSSKFTNASIPKHHTVFSTSCAPQQHWESMVFFYHAYKVGQPGTVTRITSGCSDKEQKEQQTFFDNYIKPMRPNDFFIHFTPDYSRIQKSDGAPYKYMNKPYGLRHWMEDYLKLPQSSAAIDDDIVVLMDPDMILLRPLTFDFSDVENQLFVEDEPRTRMVRHGFPISQQDGYLNNEWMRLDRQHILGKDHANATVPKPHEGPRHWNTGPPYLATARDMYQIAVKWTEFAPRVVQIHPHLFSEMYGFIYATLQLQLPFTLLRSIVVSVTTTRTREGWALVDGLNDEEVQDVCRATPPPGTKIPMVLHYCERYMYGPMFFSKYRLKKNIMNCEKGLLQPPSKQFVGQFNYTVSPPRADLKDNYRPDPQPITSNRTAKREAFMLCGLTRSINEALIHHKHAACPGNSANLEMTYTVFNDPSNY